MLYSIIPPILVVLSLSGIVIFLMKKASAVAELDEKKVHKRDTESDKFEKESGESRVVILRKAAGGLGSVLSKSAGIVSGFTSGLVGKVRRVRNKEVAGNFSRTELGEPEEIMENSRSGQYRAEPGIKRRRKEKYEDVFQRRRRMDYFETKSDQEVKPLIKDPMPRKNVSEKKDLFENILIERIAANPKDIEAYERLGEYYLEIENWNYAKECFKQVIKLNPGNVNVKMKMRKLERMFEK